jgi:hypothetical protein
MKSRFFLFNKWSTPVNVLLLANPGDQDDPIPGGCGSGSEMVPNLSVKWHDPYFSARFQQAASNTSLMPTCEESSRNLKYTVYTSYLPHGDYGEQTYFEFLVSMSSKETIMSYGDQVEEIQVDRFMKNKSSFVGYPDIGVVVAVVVSDLSDGGHMFAYVPTIVYPCSRTYLEQCARPVSSSEVSVCIALIVAGLFLVLCGHRFFKCEMFLTGAVAGAILIYIALGSGPTLDIYYTEFYLSVGVGALCAGITWLLLWILIGSPVFSVVLPAAMTGFLLGSLLFFLHPFYLPSILSPLVDYSVNLWLLFAIFTLLVAVLGVYFTHKLNILSCAVIGSFLIIYGCGRIAMTSVPYVLINVLYRATIPGFELVNIIPPLQTQEVFLLITWLLLVLSGVTFQLWVETGREDFPSPKCCNRDRARYRTLEDQRWLLDQLQGRSGQSGSAPPVTSKSPVNATPPKQLPPYYDAYHYNDDERRPLLTSKTAYQGIA